MIGGEPHSALSHRAVGVACKAIFGSRRIMSCGSLERRHSHLDVHRPFTWPGFPGVAVVLHQKRCSKS